MTEARRFRARIVPDDETSGCGIELPFVPKEVFGKARAPVRVKIGEHEFRSTTFTMSGSYWIPLNRQNREAAGVSAGDTVTVELTLDDTPRVVEVPKDFEKALSESPAALAAFEKLSFTHRREHVEAIASAKKPETRERRIRKAIEVLEEHA